MAENRVGPPVRGADFYGREAFVKLVSEKLKAGHVLLAAPRRFGKTSVMYRLIDAPSWDYRIVHVDLEHLTEPAELITLLIERLLRDSVLSKVIGGLSSFSREVWSRFRENIEEVELVKVKIKLRNQIRGNWKETGEELFKRVSRSSTTVVFFLDEFPMMIDRMARSRAHREEAKTMLRWLRALRHEVPNVRFLIAGSIGIDRVLNELGEMKAINDLEKIPLKPFPPKVASAFLDELDSFHELRLSPQTKRRMLQVVGVPVPYFLQIVFSEAAKSFAQYGQRITPKTIDQIYKERILGVDCKTYFDHYYVRLRDYLSPREERAAKLILRKLAFEDELTRDACYRFYLKEAGPDGDQDEFNRVMSDLENDFYISFDAEIRRYRFSCKLLRDWWLRHYGMEIDFGASRLLKNSILFLKDTATD